MSFSQIQAINSLNLNNTQAIESFSTNDASGPPSSGFLEEMMTKAATKLSAENTTITNELNATLESDLGTPFNMLKLQHIDAKKGMLFNFTTSVVSKIPKALEILNK